MDDALDTAACLGLDGNHVAAIAERDDGLLEGASELGSDERVEPPAEPVVGDADRRSQAAQTRRCRVQQLTGRVEGSGQRAPQRRQPMQLAAQLPQERPAFVGERSGQARGGVEGLGDLQELGRVQPAAASRPVHSRPDVVRGSDADAGAFHEERSRLVGLVQAPGDEHRIG